MPAGDYSAVLTIGDKYVALVLNVINYVDPQSVAPSFDVFPTGNSGEARIENIQPPVGIDPSTIKGYQYVIYQSGGTSTVLSADQVDNGINFTGPVNTDYGKMVDGAKYLIQLQAIYNDGSLSARYPANGAPTNVTPYNTFTVHFDTGVAGGADVVIDNTTGQLVQDNEVQGWTNDTPFIATPNYTINDYKDTYYSYHFVGWTCAATDPGFPAWKDVSATNQRFGMQTIKSQAVTNGYGQVVVVNQPGVTAPDVTLTAVWTKTLTPTDASTIKVGNEVKTLSIGTVGVFVLRNTDAAGGQEIIGQGPNSTPAVTVTSLTPAALVISYDANTGKWLYQANTATQIIVQVKVGTTVTDTVVINVTK
jgi:hypothetical protein